MKTNFKKSLIFITTLALLSGCGASNEEEKINNIFPEPVLTKGDDFAPYDIYPSPQEINYKEESIIIPKRLNVVIEEGIDIYTKNKLFDVLAKKDVTINQSETILNNGVLSVNLGIYLSNGEVDKYISSFSSTDLTYVNEKIDAYYLKIAENSITIIGKTTDAVYYGLSTLEMIFDKTENTIRQLEIFDYSDSMYRGFIEGYYGIPWTSKERQELMRFGSKFKSNIYIYAPKDDSYHSTNWRGLYSEDDLKILKEQIKVGSETKTRFAWAIHPFLSNKITLENYDQGLKDIKNKFNQLYDAGVRQFFVSADDIAIDIVREDYLSDKEYSDALKAVSKENGELHNKLLNDLVTYNATKQGCYDLLFVPSAYCYESSVLHIDIDAYYEGLMPRLDESIQFFWTGNTICSSVSNLKTDEFKEITDGRTPIMWLNWPVTDYSPSHILLGKAEVLDISFEDSDVDFLGVVTNPMQQAEPSKLAIFAICDYAWNTKKFDVDKSYKESFKYVEEKAYDQFYELAQHLTNATPYEGRYFEEAKTLATLINNYNYAVTNNDNIDNRVIALINYFDDLVDKGDYYLDNASNTLLLNSIRPWIMQVIDRASAASSYLSILRGTNLYTPSKLRELLDNGENKYERSFTYQALMLNAINYNNELRNVESGVRVLTPFVNSIRNAAVDLAKLSLGDPTGVIYDGFLGVYEGSVDDIIDGDDNTYCWFNGYPSEDAYIRIDLEEIKEIKDIRVLSGKLDGSDYLLGVVEVSSDAKTYQEVGTLASKETVIDLRSNPVNARFIRIRNVGTESWVAMRDVSINVLGEPVDISYTGFEGIQEGILDYLVDGNDNSQCWFKGTPSESASITIDYKEIKEISSIRIINGNISGEDYMTGVVELSLDGIEYSAVGSISKEETIIDLTDAPVNARYLRIRNQNTGHWIALREITLNVDLSNTIRVRTSGMTFIDETWNSLDNMTDGDLSTYTWFDWHCPMNSYIELDLRKVTEINKVSLYQKATNCSIDGNGISDAFESVKFVYSSDGVSWADIDNSTYNNQEDIVINLTSPIQARYIRVVSLAEENASGVSIREFSIN